jgi:hypothetical protein
MLEALLRIGTFYLLFPSKLRMTAYLVSLALVKASGYFFEQPAGALPFH